MSGKMGTLIDLTGQRFERLVVIGRGSPRPYSNGAVWVCKCDCGNIIETLGASLRKGDAKSCGCYRKDFCSRVSASHKLPNRRLRNIWRNMISRCENPKAVSYPLYGAKGVSVCNEWKDVEAFIQWALASGYTEGLTIDRIHGDKGYSPENCRWVSKIEQQNNRCNNHLLTVNGKTDTIANWARASGLSHSTISARIRMGWSDEKAVLTPKGKYQWKNSA